MENYDVIFIENVRHIIKEKGLTFYFVEKSLNLYNGFFSKVYDQDSHRLISLEAALKISQFLEMSIEDLVSPDLKKKYILKEYKKRLDQIKEQEEVILAKIKEIES